MQLTPQTARECLHTQVNPLVVQKTEIIPLKIWADASGIHQNRTRSHFLPKHSVATTTKIFPICIPQKWECAFRYIYLN